MVHVRDLFKTMLLPTSKLIPPFIGIVYLLVLLYDGSFNRHGKLRRRHTRRSQGKWRGFCGKEENKANTMQNF